MRVQEVTVVSSSLVTVVTVVMGRCVAELTGRCGTRATDGEVIVVTDRCMFGVT